MNLSCNICGPLEDLGEGVPDDDVETGHRLLMEHRQSDQHRQLMRLSVELDHTVHP